MARLLNRLAAWWLLKSIIPDKEETSESWERWQDVERSNSKSTVEVWLAKVEDDSFG